MFSSRDYYIRLAMLVSGLFLLPLCQGQSSMAALDRGRSLFAAGDHANAEAGLFADNTSKPNTGAWYLESGIKLMHLASSFANRHDPANARAAAGEAISALQTAEVRLVSEKDLIAAARADELIGTIYELILKDDTSALAAYRKALIRNPNTPGAKNANARFGASGKG
jgi:tetratricopeptide (TPR) repeat protein